MTSEELFVLVLMSAMAAGVLIVVLGLRQRAHQIELAHRERMAMIERGVVPRPEMDPGHSGWSGQQQRVVQRHDFPSSTASHRSMTLGIVIVAIGLGFMSVIGIAAETPSVALGLGGAIAIVGISFIVISQVKRTSAVQPFNAPPPIPQVRQNEHPERPSDPNM